MNEPGTPTLIEEMDTSEIIENKLSKKMDSGSFFNSNEMAIGVSKLGKKFSPVNKNNSGIL